MGCHNHARVQPHGTGPPIRALFDDIFLEALDERDHLALFGLGHFEFGQGRGGMSEEHVPVAFADAHSPVRESHVSAPIVHRASTALAQVVYQELLLTFDAVFAAMRPEAPKLWIRFKTRKQIVGHCHDRAESAESFEKCLPITDKTTSQPW